MDNETNIESDLSGDVLHEEKSNKLGATENKLIEELQAKLDEKTDLYMRALADLDNFKKRVQKEREENRVAVISAIVEDLLPVLDHLELGLQSVKHENGNDVISGFKMILEQFKNILETYGLVALDPLHQEFNPHEHECIRREYSETEQENIILSVMRKGYKIYDRLVRPAIVVVATKQQVA